MRDFISSGDSSPPLSQPLAAGMASGSIGILVANPTDVVKVRLQADSANSKGVRRYRGTADAYASILRNEGILGLWRGVGPNVLRCSVICAAEMAAYDEIKEGVLRKGLMQDGTPLHVVAGFAAGFVATVVGSPVDVTKTRYINATPGTYKNVWDCVVKSCKGPGGPRVFYSGFWPNVLRIGGFNTVVFACYEKVLQATGRYL